MWKKIIISLIILGGLATGIWYGLHKIEVETAPLSKTMHAIPGSAAFIFETQDIQSLWQKLSQTNVMWSELQSTEYFSGLHNYGYQLDSLLRNDEQVKDLIDNRSVIISTHMSGASKFDYLFVTAIPSGLEDAAIAETIDRITQGRAQKNHRIYDETDITDVQVAGSEFQFSYTLKNGLFIASPASALVEDAVRHLNKAVSLTDNADFMRVQSTAGRESTDGNLYINYRAFPNMLATHLNMEAIKQVLPLSNFASWTEVDLLLQPNALQFEGFTYTNDTINNYMNIFLQQEPVEVEMPDILPSNTAVHIELGISNPEQFFKDYRRFLDKNNRLFNYEKRIKERDAQCNCSVTDRLLSWIGSEAALVITEPNAGSNERNTYAVFQANSIDNAMSDLTALIASIEEKGGGSPNSELFNDHNLHQLHLNGVWADLMGELFTGIDETHFTIIDDYVVFANSRNGLRTFVKQYSSQQTLRYDPNYISFSEAIGSSSNILIYTNIARSPYIYQDYVVQDDAATIEERVDLIRKFQAAAIQYSSYKQNLFLNTVYLKYNPVYKQVTSSLWETPLDTVASRKPWLFKNHNSGNYEIVVQDDAHTLYLISTTGNVLWKRHLTEPILGDIHSIDVYKNNKLQLLFNTRSNIYLIDRNGNDVSGFPVVLDAPASHAMAVIDYDKNRTYRLLVPCVNNKIYNYNTTGKKVEGWVFPGTGSLVKTDIRHFVIGGKDYVFVAEQSGKIHLLDRRGNNRMDAKALVENASNNPVYVEKANKIDNCKVVYTDTTGTIIKHWFNGHREATQLEELTGNHYFAYADLNNDESADYILTTENQIVVYQRDGQELWRWVSEEEAISSRPYVYKQGDQSYLLFAVAGKNEVVMLNQEGLVVDGMPLFGHGAPAVGDIDKDGNLNLFSTHPDLNLYAYILK